MLGVFLSHFVSVYFSRQAVYALRPWLYAVSMVASPTFVVISGMMVGYLFEMHKEDFGRAAAKIVIRGIFLLTIGRVLIYFAHVVISGGFRPALRWGFITDTLGFCMLLGPFLVRRLSPPFRIGLGVAIFAFSSTVALWWHPQLFAAEICKEVLFGEKYSKAILAEFFPLLPWFAIYIVSSVVGQHVGVLHFLGDRDRLAKLLLRLGVSLLFVAIGMKVCREILLLSHPVLASSPVLDLLSPTGKRPPMVSYFLFYSGIGYLMIWTFYVGAARSGIIRTAADVTRMSGQTSLFVFIIQYYVYFTLLPLLGAQPLNLWPIYFLSTVAIILLITRFWYERRLGAFLVRTEAWAIIRLQRVLLASRL